MADLASLLIARAELEGGRVADVRVGGGRIAAIGDLPARPGERVLEAGCGRLLPGLHDHHIHVAALAASLSSVRLGPPEVMDEAAFAAALRDAPGEGWIRGVAYHESVAGLPDAKALDAIVADRPVRLQHRSGRMWLLNSIALERVLEGRTPPPGLEREGGRPTGRLFEADAWLREALGGAPPDFAAVGAGLVRMGVTGLTEMSPANAAPMAGHFAAERARGALPQRVLMAGALALADATFPEGLALGPAKLHLHEADLPDFDAAVAFVRAAHAQGRPVAVHCVSETELVFTLGVLDEAGAHAGDRIEHASVAPGAAVARMADLGLAVVSQPNFVAERGDAYLADVEPVLHTDLYRLRAFLDAGVPLAAGSDAPFGDPDPWAAMAAAVSRRTRAGRPLGSGEALTPEEALDLYLRAPGDLTARRRVEVGAVADLCLLKTPWAAARQDLAAVAVHATVIGGELII